MSGRAQEKEPVLRPSYPLSFKWPWRPYQQRVLDVIQLHLADRKLHVVAAPGAGKTVLGLEVFRRLDQPALVLSPTRGIRDQWVERLRDFAPQGTAWPPDWVSTDLSRIRMLTSVTYQALHTKYRDSTGEEDDDRDDQDVSLDRPPEERELESLVRRLNEAGVRVVILDEAHHLRAEWWKALKAILDKLPDATLLSLTATPPYDVTGAEWSKYEELCGPIDEEISVPELVKAGTLCPHQDYVWLVDLPDADRDAVREYDMAVRQTCVDLAADQTLRKAVETHPWVASEKPDAAAILDDPETAFALLVYMNARGLTLPAALMGAMSVDPEDLPRENRRWWQVLIRAYIKDERWPRDDEGRKHREALARLLRARGLLWRKELRMEESRPIRAKLALSPAKTGACARIYREEVSGRGDRLRLVILTDFIGDESSVGSAAFPARLAAVPVFSAVVDEATPEERPFVALLTGRVAIVHDSVEAELAALAGGKYGGSAESGISGYRRIHGDTAALLPAFTALLNSGRIRALVGTRALLGEGWDAPALNALVLASFVGSFMLTNQMRGRAIRICRADPAKAASVWHIAAVSRDTETGMSDLEDLRRRFTTFVGLDEAQPAIESGLNRMRVGYVEGGQIVADRAEVGKNNDTMKQRLAAAGNLGERWRAAIEQATEGRVVPGVCVRQLPPIRTFILRHTLRWLLLQAAYSFLAVFGAVMHSAGVWGKSGFFILVFFAACFAFVVSLPKFVRALVLWARHIPIDGAIRQIALCVRDTLCATHLIETPPRRLDVNTRQMSDGAWSVTLVGAPFYEQSLFADTMEEILGPIENPRYLLTREEGVGAWKRMDYHAVPALLATNKEKAELLHAAWVRRLGPAELIYTRTPENRALLLKARARAFSAAFRKETERMDRWQ